MGKMFDVLWKEFDDKTVFLLDTCAKNTLPLKDLPTLARKGIQGIAHLDEPHYATGTQRLEDIEQLMRTNPTLVLSEVIGELDDGIHILAEGINAIEKTIALEADEERRLKLIQIYMQRLENHRLRMFGVDPREPGFSHERVKRINRSSVDYIVKFGSNRSNLVNLLRRKGKTLNGSRYTDAHLVTVADILNQSGHEVCVITSDSDIEQLAAWMMPDSKVNWLPRTNHHGAVVYSRNTNREMKVYNPVRPLPYI